MKSNSMLLAILILLAVALSGAGFWVYQNQIAINAVPIITQNNQNGQEQTQLDNETMAWQAYRNEEFGYEIQYPSDWRKNINILYLGTERHGMIFCPPESFPENNMILLDGVGDGNNKGCGSKRRIWSVDNGNMLVEGIGEISSDDYIKNWQNKIKNPALVYLFKSECKESAYNYALLGKGDDGLCWLMKNSGVANEIFNKMLSTFKFIETGAVNKQKEYSAQNLPKFEDFLVEEIYTGVPALVDFKNNANALNFKTRLTGGAAEGPNFAGHYTVVT